MAGMHFSGSADTRPKQRGCNNSVIPSSFAPVAEDSRVCRNHFLTFPLHLLHHSPIFGSGNAPSASDRTMELIDYRRLPAHSAGYSELYYDYLYDFDEVRGFFSHDFRDPGSFQEIGRLVAARHYDRATLSSVLEEQNTAFGSPPKTFENITLLRKPTTLAVVTGQQVGLFGGPLYTVFKTITTIKLAAHLKELYPEWDFVPVFWVEGEDHDFEEMNHTCVLDAESKVVRCEYLPGGLMPDHNLGPVGQLVFDTGLEAAYRQLEAGLQKTEFTETILTLLKGAYKEGKTFLRAFTSWMNTLVQDQGLVFISSNTPKLKKILSPIFEREIAEFPQTSQLVITKSAELEERYHAQVKPKSVNLFLLHKGGRYLIEPREHDFSLKGTRHFLQKEELLTIARETPELLSANVVLRPLTQDALLPTVAYVAGPSEIAYHAQLKPVYEHFGIVQPVIFPRAGGSFVEERLKRAMDKYGLEVVEFFDDPARVVTKVLEQIADVKVDRVFDDASKRVHDALNELKFGLREIDPTLLGSLDTMASKTDLNLGVLKEKTIAAQKRRNETAVRQIERAANGLLPDGTLQERTITLVYYLNKYGPDLMRWLLAQTDIHAFKHQMLML
jgi:bacillithiol biosynthesis cysteine-adding enzyme BshC